MSEKSNGILRAVASAFGRCIKRARHTQTGPRRRRRDECVVTSASADPVTALLPAILPRRDQWRDRRIDAAETDEVLPSGLRFSYHLRRRIVRRAMLLCLIVSLGCVLAVLLLTTVRVRSLSVSGHAVYTEDEIRALSGIAIGDELLACDEAAVEARLLEACPYLKDVRVKRVSGGFSIELNECAPRYALWLEDGRAALMDETRYVAEIRDVTNLPDGLCAVRAPLPLLAREQEDGTVQEISQIPVAGESIQGDNAELTLLAALTRALASAPPRCEVAAIDISDRYDVTLTLTDGTVIALHGAEQPERRLRAVNVALEAYFATHAPLSETDRLALDVDDSCRVSIRVVPKA